MIKRFVEWIGLKEKVDAQEHEPPLFKEGEIWWCYIGENIGIEINGKSAAFTRPICILRKYGRNSFLGLPLSTKNKNGSWYAPIRFKDTDQTIVLVQGRTYDYRRLKEKMGQISSFDMKTVQDSFMKLHQK